MANLPSIKTLSQVTAWPRELRKVLECRKYSELEPLIYPQYLDDKFKPLPVFKRSTFPGFEGTRAWRNSCYNPPSVHELKMSMADELCETCGVEYIPHGHNAKSPAIEYCNSGDTYTTTLMFVNGRYRVGCWGDIVERGDYD